MFQKVSDGAAKFSSHETLIIDSPFVIRQHINSGHFCMAVQSSSIGFDALPSLVPALLPHGNMQGQDCLCLPQVDTKPRFSVQTDVWQYVQLAFISVWV